MVANDSPVYLQSASALIKTLRGPLDPPVPGGPFKIQIAHEAWATTDFNVPRKAEILQDWILDVWTRAKAKDQNNCLLQQDYHRLLLEIGHLDDLQTPPLLQIFNNFLAAISAGGAVTALPLAIKTFGALFDPQDASYKVEDWVNVWNDFLKLLSTRTLNAEDEIHLSKLFDLVASGTERSQASTTNSKKNAQSATTAFPKYAQALLKHPSLGPRLNDSIVSLLFHATHLQQNEPLGPLFASIQPSLDETAATQGCLLAVPMIFKSLVSIYHKNSFSLFTQASSSKVPHDVFVASKERDAVRSALERTNAFLDNLEVKQPNTTNGKEKWIGKIWVWQSRVAVWQALANWGGYMEREEPWGRLVDATARRAETVLSTYAGDGSPEAAVFLGTVLDALAALEKLDHDQARIGPDVVRWCLACPAEQRGVASTILSSLIRFHQLTHTIPELLTLLSSSLQGLFNTSLPEDIIQSLYDLTITGPIVTQHFREEIVTALRSANPGKRRSSHWNKIFSDLVSSITTLSSFDEATEPEVASKKRKRHQGMLPSAAALIGVHSRLITHCLDAAHETTFDGDSANDTLTNFIPFLEKWTSDGVEIPKAPQKGGDAGSAWTVATSQAGRLRLVRVAEKLLRKRVGKDEDVSSILELRACPGELKVELTLFMFHRTALGFMLDGTVQSYFSSELDALLSILESEAHESDNVSNTFWQILVEQGLALLDLAASTSQMSRLAALSIKSVEMNPFIRNLFASADIWEFSRLREALQETIVTFISSDPNSCVLFLSACPSGYLKKKARSTALEALYKEKDMGRSMPWLSRMAVESDVLGPLTHDADALVKLAKVASKTSERSPAMQLWQKAISYLCSSPSTNQDLLAKVLGHYLKVTKKVKKGKSETPESNLQAIALFFKEVTAHKVENFPEPVRLLVTELSQNVVSYVQPLLENQEKIDINQLGTLIEVYGATVRVIQWTGEQSQRVKFGTALARSVMLGLQGKGPEAFAHALSSAKAVLELMSDESGSVVEILAVIVVLYLVIPDPQLDDTVRKVFRNRVDDALKAFLEQAPTNPAQQHAVLRVMKVLAGSCTKSELVKQALQAGLLRAKTTDEAISFAESIVEDKATALQTDDILQILTIMYHALFKPISVPTFTSILNTISIINRRRPELVFATLPQMVQTLCYIFPKFQIPRSALLVGRQDLDGSSLGESESRLFSRLIVALSQAKPGKSNTHETSPLAKHVPAIFVAYVRSCADPVMGYSSGVRKELETGLFALCDLTTSGGRANARGREGEGLGTPFGLGEGPGGEGEKELWAELWKGWTRGRYVGQG